MVIHEKKKILSCEHCKKRFETQCQLNKHVKTLHNNNGNSAMHLRKHVNKVHEKNKNFGCKHCNNSYKAKSNLNKHAKDVHNKNLQNRRNEAQHKNRKDFSCPLCNILECNRENLERHMKKDHFPTKSKNMGRNRKFIPQSKYRRRFKRELKSSINQVYNLSSVPLSKAILSLLNKGLGYCPTPKGINDTQIVADFTRLERSMAWFYIFGEINSQNDSEEKEFIFEKEVKTNLPKVFPKEITEFITSCQSEYFGTVPKKILPNLSPQEKRPLQILKGYKLKERLWLSQQIKIVG